MEDLKPYLRSGERVLCESCPEDVPFLEGELRSRILLKWVIAAIFVMTYLAVDFSDPTFGPGMRVLVVLVAGAIILTPVGEYVGMRRQRYFLTDQRAILLSGDGSVFFMDYDHIDDCRLLEDVAQGGSIAMGSIIMADARNRLRWQTCHPRMALEDQEEGRALGMVFYEPKGKETMVQTMRENGVSVN